MMCGDIQSVLFDYMSRELGPARSELVRGHLRKCPACRKEAAEIRETLELLQVASRDPTGVPDRLSEDRRARLVRAYMHPVLDWVYTHHVLVSVVMAVVVIAVALAILLKVRADRLDRLDPGPTVTIGPGPPRLR
jgi:predicted anti-sigma-YlaC factor YlaD